MGRIIQQVLCLQVVFSFFESVLRLSYFGCLHRADKLLLQFFLLFCISPLIRRFILCHMYHCYIFVHPVDMAFSHPALNHSCNLPCRFFLSCRTLFLRQYLSHNSLESSCSLLFGLFL